MEFFFFGKGRVRVSVRRKGRSGGGHTYADFSALVNFVQGGNGREGLFLVWYVGMLG